MEQQAQTKNWYDKYHNYFMIVPAILFISALIFLVSFYHQNGDIIHKDISLKGGTTITVNSPTDLTKLNAYLQGKLPEFDTREISDLATGKQIAFIVDSTSSSDEVKSVLEAYLGFSLTEQNSSTEFTGAVLSSGFYEQLLLAVIFAFTFMGAVVFFLFGSNKIVRAILIILALITPFLFLTNAININVAFVLSLAMLAVSVFFYVRYSIPSFAVISCAFIDITMTLAVVDLLGIKVSSAGIIAFLMLIGYSVDSDILLTTRVTRRKESSVNAAVYSAFKTGIVMTLTAFVAVFISLLITRNLSGILDQIFTILTIGLLFDILNTWITNASIIKWYAEHKK